MVEIVALLGVSEAFKVC